MPNGPVERSIFFYQAQRPEDEEERRADVLRPLEVLADDPDRLTRRRRRRAAALEHGSAA
jgi:hypothetical protein